MSETSQIPDIAALMQKSEALHPDLVPYLTETSFGQAIQHPLIYSMFHHDAMNAMVNAQYEHKLKYIERCREKSDWSQFIWMHERPYRMEKFYEIQDELSDKEYWDLFGSIWSDSENLWQYGSILEELITNCRSNRSDMMDKSEKEFLETLPDKITVYRGHHTHNRFGYSWTLSYWRAKWFSKRLNQNKKDGVVKGVIDKKNIIAVLLGRNELEVVCDPSNLKKIKSVRAAKHEPWLNDILNAQPKKLDSYHGRWHWEKVELNAIALAKKTPDADEVVARIFSLIHDTQRENEHDDPEHGERAAKYAHTLYDQGKLPITMKQLDILREACIGHEKGKITDDPTIGVCWDADRLDLTRVGIIPDPKLLSTAAAKKYLWEI